MGEWGDTLWSSKSVFILPWFHQSIHTSRASTVWKTFFSQSRVNYTGISQHLHLIDIWVVSPPWPGEVIHDHSQEGTDMLLWLHRRGLRHRGLIWAACFSVFHEERSPLCLWTQPLLNSVNLYHKWAWLKCRRHPPQNPFGRDVRQHWERKGIED